MLKRRTLVCLALTVAIGVGIYLFPRSPRFTDERYDRIQIGMTLAEVEAVLGCPPGEYAQMEVLSMPVRNANWTRPREWGFAEWAADLDESPAEKTDSCWQCVLHIRVWFDHGGKVADKARAAHHNLPTPTLLERLRVWVGW